VFCSKKKRQRAGGAQANEPQNPEEDRKKKEIESNEKKKGENISGENPKMAVKTPTKNVSTTPKKDKPNATSERKAADAMKESKKNVKQAAQASPDQEEKPAEKLKTLPRKKRTRSIDGKIVEEEEDSDTLKGVASIQNYPEEGTQVQDLPKTEPI
ncbi:hypothetical protein OSTOST_10952, partial [Ostertagia ostertagi]